MRTIVLIHTSGQVQTWTQPKPLAMADLQRLVGGYFERVSAKYEGRTRDLWCNENGIALGLAPNPAATALVRAKHPGARVTIVGPAVLDFPTPSAKPAPSAKEPAHV